MSRETGSIESMDELRLLRAQLQAQSAEIARLNAQLTEAPERLSRRGLVKGLGLGSLVALGAAGISLAGAETASAASGAVGESSDLAGELPAFLTLIANHSPIEGEVTQPGHEGKIECLYFSSTVLAQQAPAYREAPAQAYHSPQAHR